MDQIVAQALTVYAKLISAKRREAAVRVTSSNGNGHRPPLKDAPLRHELNLTQ
jgi:hypothetical protein